MNIKYLLIIVRFYGEGASFLKQTDERKAEAIWNKNIELYEF